MSTEDNLTLGEKIKKDIKEKKLNGSAIAREMNVSRQVINQIDERKKFDIEFLQRLKDASGLDYTNYIFNPRSDNYESAENLVTTAREPGTHFEEGEQQITINISVSGGITKVGLHFAEFLQTLKRETDKYGLRIE